MTAHSSTLAWRILWTEEPGRLHPWVRKESDATEGLSTAFGVHSTTKCNQHEPGCMSINFYSFWS